MAIAAQQQPHNEAELGPAVKRPRIEQPEVYGRFRIFNV